MYSFNEKLSQVTLKELLVLIVFILIVKFLFDSFNVFQINLFWVNIVVIVFFIFKLRGCFSSFMQDFLKIFSGNYLKIIFTIVILNIFISYGFLYLSNFTLNVFYELSSSVMSVTYFNKPLFIFGGFLTTVFISPISEELIFRGVMLNRIKLIVPTMFSILITSILFASLHSFGSIISAFIFAICMAILYLKTDNILVPIFAHFLNNLIAESIVIVDSGNILFTNNFVMMVMSILAIVSSILIFILIKSQWNNIK